MFKDGILNTVILESSFPKDSTAFTSDRSNEIEEGMSRSDVENLLGTLYGVSPSVISGVSYSTNYTYRWYDRESLGLKRNRLRVDFDSNDKVVDVAFIQNTTEFGASILDQ